MLPTVEAAMAAGQASASVEVAGNRYRGNHVAASLPRWHFGIRVTHLSRIIRLIDGRVVADKAAPRISVVGLWMIGAVPDSVIVDRVMQRRSPAGIRKRFRAPAFATPASGLTIVPVAGLISDVAAVVTLAVVAIAVAVAGLLKLTQKAASGD